MKSTLPICFILFIIVEILISPIQSFEEPQTQEVHSEKWMSNNLLPVGGSISQHNGGCYCAGGNIPSQPSYSKIPQAQDGAGCIGGCGGSPYIFSEDNSNVKELKVWMGGDHDGATAIYVSFFNGKTHTAGSIPAHNPDGQITFDEGERIVGTIELCGNGIGTRLGHISFKTSSGQKFSVGKSHTPYYFDSGNSFLMGIFGEAGDEIDHMGLFMMKEIKSTELIHVKYPTIDRYKKGLTPRVYTDTLCNDAPHTKQTQTTSFSKQVGTEWDFSLTLSFKYGASLSVSAGIPKIADISGEAHWEIGASSTMSLSHKDISTQTESFPVTVPPRSRVKATFSWWNSKADLPYTADLKYYFSDGSEHTFSIKDKYSGVYITQAQGSYHTEKLKDGEKCS
eukprot:gb/GECH01012797.1/.p1 GENE.gb/GECH01012797.1/~~gb/GECH01012797.1/.p1  ORF type:complete len:395 (+),score=81.48 gb/GECH01012797.1/:1-1185(+)